jgi:hypothetical protein
MVTPESDTQQQRVAGSTRHHARTDPGGRLFGLGVFLVAHGVIVGVNPCVLYRPAIDQRYQSRSYRDGSGVVVTIRWIGSSY